MEVIVVGSGPAGISAALYAVRGGAHVTVLGRDGGALGKTDRIDNYYGFPGGVSGRQLLANGIRQARELGVLVYEEEVLHIGFEDGYTVKTTRCERGAGALILATGAFRKTPDIPGLARLEGAGVSYCAVCDAMFYKNRDVAVLGAGEYALHEALDLLPLASSVTMLTNGQTPGVAVPPQIRLREGTLTELAGEDVLEEVRFSDGTRLAAAGLFVALGVAGSDALARKIGVITAEGHVDVGENMATNVPGFFAAGDCTGGLLQVSKAVADGARAGLAAVQYLRQRNGS